MSFGSCIKPSNFCNMINISLHNFSDASEKGLSNAVILEM